MGNWIAPFHTFYSYYLELYTLDLIQADTRAISGKLGRVSFQFFPILFFFFSTKKVCFPDKLCGKQAFADRIDCSFFPARLTRQGSPDCHVNLVLDKCSMLKSINWRLSFLFSPCIVKCWKFLKCFILFSFKDVKDCAIFEGTNRKIFRFSGDKILFVLDTNQYRIS